MFIGRWNKNKALPDLMQVFHKENLLFDKSCQTSAEEDLNVYFFGVLYNKKELGYAGVTNDAEIVRHIYQQRGYRDFACLDGSFTCVLCTPEMTFIFRDHHGVSCQVYYTDSYFASSLSLLQTTDGFSVTPNYRMLSSFLTIGYIATPSSALMGVHKLGAGEVLLVKDGAIERVQLFPTANIQPIISETEDLETLSERYGVLHTEAIKRRITNSRNVGILLSGGYDSGCNLAALRKIYTGDIHSFSIGFKGDNWTELPLARCMSDTFHTIHTEYEIDGSEITALPQIVDYLGDPFVEGGLMVNYAAMRLVGENKPDVILGGDGSDQYFGTSGREVAMHYLISKYGMKPAMNLLYGILSHSMFDKNNTYYRIRFHLDKILNILQGDLFGFPSFRLKEMVQSPAYLSIFEALHPDMRSFEHLYTQHAYKSDLEKIINQVILFKASKMADMFGNTIAFPYMDLDLYNFLKQLPVSYKCRGTNPKEIAKGHATAKFLLKYHYKPMLPEAITSKKKQGGFAPMPLFFKDNRQRARIADYIMQSSITRDFLKRDVVESFIRQYDREASEAGNWFWYKQNKAIQYFNLLTLSIWWERFVEGKQVTGL